MSSPLTPTESMHCALRMSKVAESFNSSWIRLFNWRLFFSFGFIEILVSVFWNSSEATRSFFWQLLHDIEQKEGSIKFHIILKTWWIFLPETTWLHILISLVILPYRIAQGHLTSMKQSTSKMYRIALRLIFLIMAVSGIFGASEEKDLTDRGIGSGAIGIACELKHSDICRIPHLQHYQCWVTFHTITNNAASKVKLPCQGEDCPPSCAPGTYGNECLSCAPGTFSRYEGASRCMKCSTGYIAPDAGSAYCYPCPTGTTSTNGITCVAPVLSTCIPGEGNQVSGGCTRCPNGSASPGGYGAVCTVCPPGTFTHYLLPAINDVCKKCNFGNVAPLPGSLFCNPCQTGYTSPDGINCNRIPITPIDCQPGYAQWTGMPNQCEACPAGSYSPGGYSATCTQCAPGTASDSEGSEICYSCMSYNQIAPYIGSTQCTPCPYGHTTDNGISCYGNSPPAASPIEAEVAIRLRKWETVAYGQLCEDTMCSHRTANDCLSDACQTYLSSIAC